MSENESKNNNKRIVEWQKRNTSTILVRLNNSNDSDILEKLETVPAKNTYIKELIRADIKKSKRHKNND